jgi:hypothetical protein
MGKAPQAHLAQKAGLQTRASLLFYRPGPALPLHIKSTPSIVEGDRLSRALNLFSKSKSLILKKLPSRSREPGVDFICSRLF